MGGSFVILCARVSMVLKRENGKGDIHLGDVYPKYGKRGSRTAEGWAVVGYRLSMHLAYPVVGVSS
jgi:hypothetical protein